MMNVVMGLDVSSSKVGLAIIDLNQNLIELLEKNQKQLISVYQSLFQVNMISH